MVYIYVVDVLVVVAVVVVVAAVDSTKPVLVEGRVKLRSHEQRHTTTTQEQQKGEGRKQSALINNLSSKCSERRIRVIPLCPSVRPMLFMSYCLVVVAGLSRP